MAQLIARTNKNLQPQYCNVRNCLRTVSCYSYPLSISWRWTWIFSNRVHDSKTKLLRRRDLLTGTQKFQEAINLRDDLIDLLQKGGFNLRKWGPNNADLTKKWFYFLYRKFTWFKGSYHKALNIIANFKTFWPFRSSRSSRRFNKNFNSTTFWSFKPDRFWNWLRMLKYFRRSLKRWRPCENREK